jgi:N-acetyl-D-muramate 6-phosphate phosphatase
MEPSAILFDLDGTLLDTAPDMIGALNSLRVENRLSAVPFDSARASVSHGSARLVRLGFPDADEQRFSELQRRFLEIYGTQLSTQTRLFPGMEGVLAKLSNRGIPAGIVTNKPARFTERLLEELKLRERFACVVSGDTVSERKPHPLPMLHAAKLAKVAPAACIYVGDAERDVQAAHAAGMRAVVAIYGYLRADENWQDWGGDGFIAQPAELLEWLEEQQPA